MPSAKLIKELNHHAYALIGERSAVLPRFLSELGSRAAGPDFYAVEVEVWGVKESRDLVTRATVKSFGGQSKYFVIAADSFTTEAQNALLKLLEEPALNTHFFLIVPQFEHLLPTLRSRLMIFEVEGKETESDLAPKFITASLAERLKLIVALTTDEAEGQLVRNFFTGLEKNLLQRIHGQPNDSSLIATGRELARVQKYWNDPAAARRLLLEHLALTWPLRTKI